MNHINLIRGIKGLETNHQEPVERLKENFSEFMARVNFFSSDLNKEFPWNRRVLHEIKPHISHIGDFEGVEDGLLKDNQIEALIQLFFARYKEGWPEDSFDAFLKSVMTNKVYFAKIVDALIFYLYTPEMFESSNIQGLSEKSSEMIGIPKPMKGVELYNNYADNVLVFLSSFFKNNPMYLAFPTKTLED